MDNTTFASIVSERILEELRPFVFGSWDVIWPKKDKLFEAAQELVDGTSSR